MDAAHQYRVTKYDPARRDRQGAFLGDDWTSIADIGKTFGGVVLTPEAYQRVEDAYVLAATGFLSEVGVPALVARDVENHRASPFAPAENAAVFGSNLEDAIGRLLREEFWCRLEADGCFIHIGYDYYMYVGVPTACEQACTLSQSLGLFVEPFRSPYHREPW